MAIELLNIDCMEFMKTCKYNMELDLMDTIQLQKKDIKDLQEVINYTKKRTGIVQHLHKNILLNCKGFLKIKSSGDAITLLINYL